MCDGVLNGAWYPAAMPLYPSSRDQAQARRNNTSPHTELKGRARKQRRACRVELCPGGARDCFTKMLISPKIYESKIKSPGVEWSIQHSPCTAWHCDIISVFYCLLCFSVYLCTTHPSICPCPLKQSKKPSTLPTKTHLRNLFIIHDTSKTTKKWYVHQSHPALSPSLGNS